ncbi:AI-2E family transporter [soil metagenome]
MSPRWSTSTKRLVAVAMVLVGVYVLYLARGILTPFVLGALLVLILKPIIDFLHRRLRFRHALAVVTSYVLLLGVIVAVPVVFLPALGRSAAALDVGTIAAELSDWAARTLNSLRNLELFGSSVDLSSSIDPLIAALETGGEDFEFDTGAIFGGAMSVTSAVFAGVIGFLTTMILTLVISVYLALTLNASARDGAYSIVPVAFVPEVRLLSERLARVWADYLRGQLTVAAVVGVLTTVVMFALGVPGAMVLGVIGGLFNIIPTFGPIFASVVAALVALVQGSNHIDVSNLVFALIVIGAYAVIQQLESNLITPRILGGAMSVSPLAILLGILIGFSAAGVLGAIIAVPMVASARVIFLYIRAKLLDEDPFPEVEPRPRATVGEGGIILPADSVGADDERPGEFDADDEGDDANQGASSIPPDL